MRISRPSAPKCQRCRRDLLLGEDRYLYQAEGRAPIQICSYCRAEAEAEGWRPVKGRGELGKE